MSHSRTYVDRSPTATNALHTGRTLFLTRRIAVSLGEVKRATCSIACMGLMTRYPKNATDPRNPFVRLIKANSLPPLLNVASLKRTLAQAECIPDLTGGRTTLYRLSSDPNPMDETERVSILGLVGMGCTPANALAFRYIAKIEGNPIYVLGDLYADVHDELPEANEARVVVGATVPGSTAADVLCIVQPEGLRLALLHERRPSVGSAETTPSDFVT
ncbi:hypothetical protein C8R44DRAFT_736206 [Mycena epipterygia]|nr:hypothetical protein C8R44DRAFT_736206 [Mycena epipterygia]